jgi:hypothetical protein
MSRLQIIIAMIVNHELGLFLYLFQPQIYGNIRIPKVKMFYNQEDTEDQIELFENLYNKTHLITTLKLYQIGA